jgi:hypothetical protein
MNETKFNKFKPDTGAEFYEEENAGIKVYSPKNNRKENIINSKYTKNLIKEESPENRFPPTNNLHNNNINMNFLPHITFYRNHDEFKKTKNIFH